MGKTIKDRNYSFEHTKQRLKERYHIDITIKHYDMMCQQILDEKDIFLIEVEYQYHDTQIIYDLHFPHRNPIRVVWSEERECITTVLERK